MTTDAQQPGPDRIAKAIYRSWFGTHPETVDDHFAWYHQGKSNPDSCVHYSNVAKALKAAEAVAALPQVSEGDRVLEKFEGFIATIRSMKCATARYGDMGPINDAIANAVNARIDLILAAVPVELAALTAPRDTEGK